MKPFRYRKLPKRVVQIELVKRLAKHYRIRVTWLKTKNIIGSGFHAVRRNDRGYYEYIGMDGEEYRDKISTFFHELGHSYCYNNKIWAEYHGAGRVYIRNNRYYRTRKSLRIYIRTAYRAEQWVDRWAKTEMKKWFPYLKYRAGYTTKEDKKWFYRNHLNFFRNNLKRINEAVSKTITRNKRERNL